ncbi:MAG: ATP-binding cassette domain-containing protein [Rhodocyclaceae bacterium]|nr:ATP-binding cassette domain-containing protein [Rhodocyclaceae bacterium]
MEKAQKARKPNKDNSFLVVGSDVKGHQKRVSIEDERKGRTTLTIHRFAQVGKGDHLWLDPVHRGNVSVISTEEPTDRIRISPHFESEASIRVGAESVSIRVKELTSVEDVDSYAFLEAFHYRTSAPIVDQEDSQDETESVAASGSSATSTGGRKAVLLCSAKMGAKWNPVGYIELQMPLLMVKPRHELLSMPYEHTSRPVQWKEWNQHSIREYVNCIVRIARVVTSPEFRGLGVSRVLVDTAKQYARERWHIGGRRPLFIEISAEMLRHVDFVSGSGFIFAGYTEGNLERIHRDMTHMQKNYDVSSGIMSLQKKYLTQLQSGAKALGKTFNEMLSLVAEVSRDPEALGNLQPAEYYTVRSVLRMPIPYYIAGLDNCSEGYIANAIEAKNSSTTKRASPIPKREFSIKSGRIRYASISIQSRYEVPSTQHSQAIMDAFGVDGRCLTQTIIKDFPLEVSGGNIIFIGGPSGTGKSLLLRALDVSKVSENILIHRVRSGKEEYTVGWMSDLPDGVPLIEHLASKFGMDKALSALNQAGLSEAFVYLKPFNLLSRGQKYRARLAALALGDEQVWLIDEFCADLDPLTAKIVATNLRKHVIKYQRIAVVAAANYQHFIDALRPTRIVSLRQGFAPIVQSYREFSDEFHPKVD